MEPTVYRFVCEVCGATCDEALVCRMVRGVYWCVHCCECDTHKGAGEVEGTVIFPWRGLHDSPHRTRRHR